MWIPLFLVAAGGAIGAAARYAFGTLFASAFPWATLVINAVGSFLLGIIVFSGDPRVASDQFRLFAATGVLGGFTTFSTFSVDTFRMIEQHQLAWALGNILLSLTFSLAGIALARMLVR